MGKGIKLKEGKSKINNVEESFHFSFAYRQVRS